MLPPGLEFLAPGRVEPFMATPGFNQCSAVQNEARSSSGQPKSFAQQLMEEVKEAIEPDLQAQVVEKLENVWAQGERDVQQFQHENRIYMEELQKSVSEFRERQEALEHDTASLQQMLASLLAQLGPLATGSLGALGANNIFSGAFADLENKFGEFLQHPSPGDTSTAAPSSSGSVSPPLTFEHSPLLLGSGSVSPPTTLEHSPVLLGSGLETPAHGSLNCYFECASPYLDAPDMGSSLKLPDVPAFPFPTTPQALSAPPTPAPLSLASALGIEGSGGGTQQAETACDAGFLTPMSAPASSPSAIMSPPPIVPPTAPPSSPPSAGGFIFTVPLRKAEGSTFGLDLTPSQDDRCLCIVGVNPGGAAEAWNRQCSSSGAAEKVLMVGDKLVSVNGVAGSVQEMRRECETKHLLRLMVVRCENPSQAGLPSVLPIEPVAPSSPPCTSVSSPERPSSQLRAEASAFEPPSSLRADASAFVPMSVSACSAACSSSPAC